MKRKINFDRKALFWTLIGFNLGWIFMLLMIGQFSMKGILHAYLKKSDSFVGGTLTGFFCIFTLGIIPNFVENFNLMITLEVLTHLIWFSVLVYRRQLLKNSKKQIINLTLLSLEMLAENPQIALFQFLQNHVFHTKLYLIHQKPLDRLYLLFRQSS